MTTLAPKLPWQHAFAGGFNRLGGQALPTDADAIDYLNRVAAADGAAVEVGVAQAIDAFVKGCKSDSAGYAGNPSRTNWDALQACCIMASARTISGALVPLKRYGPEQWAEQTPTIVNGTGSVGSWDQATLTLTNTGTGGESTRPRFDFNVGTIQGMKYRIAGRLSGDLGNVWKVWFSNTILTLSPDGSFSGTLTADAYPLSIYLYGNLGNASVRIEELSVKADNAPTAQGGWTSNEYSRGGTTPGLKGNGSTLYLNTNRAANADGQDDAHHAVYATDGGTSLHYKIGSYSASSGVFAAQRVSYLSGANRPSVYLNVTSGGAYTSATTSGNAAGFYGASRKDSTEFSYAVPGASGTHTAASAAPNNFNQYVFGFNNNGTLTGQFEGRLSYYSIGSALDLAALDARTSHLMNSIRFTLLTGLSPAGYDPATLAYLLAAYTAGGSLS